MFLYNYWLTTVIDGVKVETKGQREAESADALHAELRKTPGYAGSGTQRADARPKTATVSPKLGGLGWIDPMFKDL